MIKNCLARIGCLTVIAVIGVGAWWFRDDIGAWWNRLAIGASSRPSEASAARAETKLHRFAEDLAHGELRLDQTEIQSLLTYRTSEVLPPGVSDPLVEVRDSTILLSARVEPDSLEGLAPAEMIDRFLPDSARVLVELAPDIVRPGVAGVRILVLQAGSLVVPSLMVPWLLGGLGLEGIEAAGSTLLVPLPARVLEFAVRDGVLVLKTANAGFRTSGRDTRERVEVGLNLPSTLLRYPGAARTHRVPYRCTGVGTTSRHRV